jgi:hypothetical protein
MTEITKSSIASAFAHLVPTRSMGEGIASGFPWITYRKQQWGLRYEGQAYRFMKDADTPSPHLDVVILADNPAISKLYYSGAFNEDSREPPACASIDGVRPDAGVPEPQSKLCATCKHDAWGSHPNGGKGKACQDHKRLAVLIMPQMLKNILTKPLVVPVSLRVPPASLKSFKNYSDGLQHRGIHQATVITRISFDSEKQFQMNFRLLQALTNAEAPVILKLLEAPATAQITGTAPEIEEDDAPELPPAQVKTGLLEAFDEAAPEDEPPPTTPSPRGRGRPPGSTNKPKSNVIDAAKVVKERADKLEADKEEGNGDEPWQESDDALDQSVNALLGQKIQGMLK